MRLRPTPRRPRRVPVKKPFAGVRPLYVYAATAVFASAATVLVMLAATYLARRNRQGAPPGAPLTARQCAGSYDLVVVNGLLLDGLGHEPLRADLGVREGRVACVGSFQGADARRVIDAVGKVVAPGFIDVHTHIERNLPADRWPFFAPNFVRQGVTTIITGNCGRSELPVGAMLDRLGRDGTQVNVASFVGHNSVRRMVMGTASRAPTAAELSGMRTLVERSMAEGALGLSTGLTYLPGAYARRDELVALARAASAGGGMYVTHMRDEGVRGAAAIEEAIDIGASASVPVHISHFKAQGRSQWGTAAARLGLVDEARGRGLRVSIDQYPYAASSTTLEALLPAGDSDDGTARSREGLRDPRARARLRAGMSERLRESGWNDYSFARVAYCPSDLSLNGLDIAQIAARRLGAPATATLPTSHSAGRDEPAVVRQADLVLDLLASGGAQMIYFDMSEDDVVAVMRHPDTMFGSDSGVRLENAPAVPHPRGLGTFPRVLGHYVRALHLLSLPDAVRRMTSLPAQTFGLKERGKLVEGYWADIVIFDADSITDMATYDSPLLPPEGILYVIVNGVPVLEGGRLSGASPGKALRR
jgi:N-acyl-D-amino-acid deacylase